MAHAFAMLWVLAYADITLVVDDHWSGNDFVPRAPAAEQVLRGLWIAVKLPDQIAGLGIEAADPAVAARKDDLGLPIDHRIGRVGPLAVQNVLAGRIVFPKDFPGVLVDGEKAW